MLGILKQGGWGGSSLIDFQGDTFSKASFLCGKVWGDQDYRLSAFGLKIGEESTLFFFVPSAGRRAMRSRNSSLLLWRSVPGHRTGGQKRKRLRGLVRSKV